MEKVQGMKYPCELPRIERYEDHDVFGGDWFASPLYPGKRCFAICRSTDTPYPTFLDSKGYIFNADNMVRNVLSDYLLALRRDGEEVDFVLDGRIGHRDGENGYTRFDGKVGYQTVFYVDDVVNYKVFMLGQGKTLYSKRRNNLRGIVSDIDSDRVFMTKCKKIESKRQLEDMSLSVASVRGYGLLLRRNAPYKGGRNGNLLSLHPEVHDE